MCVWVQISRNYIPTSHTIVWITILLFLVTAHFVLFTIPADNGPFVAYLGRLMATRCDRLVCGRPLEESLNRKSRWRTPISIRLRGAAVASIWSSGLKIKIVMHLITSIIVAQWNCILSRSVLPIMLQSTNIHIGLQQKPKSFSILTTLPSAPRILYFVQ